ncbi:MAG TPA: DUF885 family protein [Rhizomicrobium sp.]|jgi:uncharacterized protein (DUF885 family)
MLSRRHLLASAAALSATTAAPAWAKKARVATKAPVAPSPDQAAKLNGLMDAFFWENLGHNPEGATQLGLDKGDHADLKARLRDESSTGIAASKALTDDQMKRLTAVNAAALTGMDRVNYDTIFYTLDTRQKIASFDFGGASYGPSPYVVSQLTGAYQSVPDFLDTKHRIDTAADADAYLARMDAFAGQIDANTDRMQHDGAQGIMPPDFILDRTLEQMTATRTTADKSLLVTSIARRAKDKNLSPDYATKAAALYDAKIGPALDRQIELTKTWRVKAAHNASMNRFKDGDAFYAAALRSTTTTSLTPDQIHQLGLDQAKDISARIDVLLQKQGMTSGTVGERILALYQQEVYPNTDAGKADCIAYCNKRLDEIRPRLPSVFRRVPQYSFEVRRVPLQTEPGAASAFSQGPALDGSRPGIVYFNLHDSAEWPKWALSTTVFHEGLPGHQLEGGLALGNKNLPLIRKSIGFSGYAEGWALYAEQLADEIGMYDDDPLGRIGYLKFQLFRANRCVVDTGLHHLGWSREQAIQYFVDHGGDAPSFAAREVERYCVTVGQACSYKLGHTVWTKARARAQAKLGPRYDIKDFHEAGLDCGRVPLDVLDTVIDRYVADKAKA